MPQEQETEKSHYALMTGHPGHELRVLGWVSRFNPVVITLTDGSGHNSAPRLELSRQVLLDSGAMPSQLYGIASDQEIYHNLLTGNHQYFLEIANTVTKILLEYNIRYIVGDAIEGYNPTHDVCRLMINRAVREATKQSGITIENYAFPLVGHPAPGCMPEGSICMELSPDEFEFKRTHSHHYANSVGGTLATEIDLSLQQFNEDAFCRECLWPVQDYEEIARFKQQKPFYEQYGEQQVVAGIYREVIRFDIHIAPLAEALLS